MNPKLFESWLKFRSHGIAISADIEKAYLNIGVRPEDRDLMRFLWFEDPMDENSDVITYRFTRVFYGATCSQFLLSSTLHKIADMYDKNDGEFARKVRDHFYVDDLNTGADTTEEGVETYEKMKTRFSDVHLNLRKWRTNNEQLRAHIAQNEEKSKPKIADEANSDTTHNEDVSVATKIDKKLQSPPEKVLGIGWDENSDDLVMNVKEMFPNDVASLKATKRNILKVIAGIWDVVGFLQPVIVRLKLLFMLICLTSLLWDDEISGPLLKEWQDILKAKDEITELRIPRCYYKIVKNDPVVLSYVMNSMDFPTQVPSYMELVFT